MTFAAGRAGPNESPILRDAITLSETILAAGDEIEAERHLPRRIVEGLKNAGVFSMAMPRAWGGPELDPLTQFRVIEALAMADGSVGWCAMINCDGGYVTAFLDQEIARAMYPDIRAGTAVTATLTGQASRVLGGYRIRGRFPFSSGSQHCEWVWLGCVVEDNGRATSDGVPEARHCLLKMSQCEIL